MARTTASASRPAKAAHPRKGVHGRIYQQLFDHMNEGFGLHEIVLDDDGKPCDYRFLDVNRKFEELTGLRAEDVLGRTVREVLPGIDSHWIEEFGRVALTGRPALIEDYATPLGRYYRVDAFCPAKGRFACVFTDVTDHRRLIESLRVSEARFRATFDGTSTGIALVGADGRYLACNGALGRIVGYETEELRGMPFGNLTHSEDLEEDWTKFRDLMSGQRDHYSVQKRFLRKDGSLVWGNVTVSLVRAEDGRPDYAIRMVQDISVQKGAEAQLLALNAELEHRVTQRTEDLNRANRELEAFSYSVAHDLRAPVRHLTGFVRLLERHGGTNLDDKSRRYLGIIADAARRMGQLIDDLLEFSRTGRTELRTTTVDLSALVDEVRRECLSELEGSPVVWKVSPLPQVRGDRALLRAAFVNLISNALKFSRGRAEAVIEVGEARSRDGVAEVFVRDNGVGFDARYAGKLFDIFQRLHSSAEFEGTGVGLANVKRIVERHGGDIRAEGAVDRGATFYVTLPKAGEER